MTTYDFFIAGRWRGREAIRAVLETVRAHGKTAYCFIENDYGGDEIGLASDGDPDAFMARAEQLSQDHPLIRGIFARDMAAQRSADALLLVLPAGHAGHIEAGVAYGLGQRCYAVGPVDKTETLYCIFDRMFDDVTALGAADRRSRSA